VAAACAFGRCFRLRTSDAPAAEAVTHTTNAMHADTQRGRSLNESGRCRLENACGLGRSLLLVGAAGIGDGDTVGSGDGDAAGAGGSGDARETATGMPSEPTRGICAGRGKGVLSALDCAGRGKGVLSALDSDARGKGVFGRESAPAESRLGSGERVAGSNGVFSCRSKANSKVAIGRS